MSWRSSSVFRGRYIVGQAVICPLAPPLLILLIMPQEREIVYEFRPVLTPFCCIISCKLRRRDGSIGRQYRSCGDTAAVTRGTDPDPLTAAISLNCRGRWTGRASAGRPPHIQDRDLTMLRESFGRNWTLKWPPMTRWQDRAQRKQTSSPGARTTTRVDHRRRARCRQSP